MPDWGGGYTAEFGIARVDPRTWTASPTLDAVASVSKSASCADPVPLLEQAGLSVDGAFEPGWYQLAMVAGGEKVGLGVFKFERTSSEFDYGAKSVKATGFSVLKPADKMRMAAGSYAPAGSDGAQVAASLLRAACPAPVEVSGAFALASNVVYGIGMSCLEAAWLVLSAGGYCIQLGGDGAIHIRPKPTEPALELSRANADLLIPGVQDDFDVSKVPNRYYAIEGGRIAVAENDDPGSAASYPNTGEWNDAVDTSPVRVNGETLAAYAHRKLAEASVVRRVRTYTREFYPGVAPFSIVRGSMSDVGLDGDMTVASQAFACDYGITVKETAEQEVAV